MEFDAIVAGEGRAESTIGNPPLDRLRGRAEGDKGPPS